MTDLALEALKDAIRQKNALIVCGSGVSKSADPNALDWKGLLKSGIEESVGWGFADENWKKRQLQNLDEGDVDEWIAVADLFTEKLGGQDNGHFSRWLANTAGKLQLHIRDLPDAISKLACPISTTNYDDILSKATGMTPVPWSDRGQFINALNEKLPAILHLHGHWTKPESVILGTKSYQRIANDERAQFLQEFLAFKYSLVFVGCSDDGLSDQNLGKLKVWLEGWDGHGRDHFHLVTNQAWRPNRANSPIKMLKYGGDYQELPSFLLSLVSTTTDTIITSPSIQASPARQAQLQTIDYEVPREECFGRDKDIEDVVSALLNGQTPISIGGGPGMGKTTIAVNALYDSRVRAKYGNRRIFVPLDAAREPHAILTSLATALGLSATGGDNHLFSLIGAMTSEAPVAAILDNADTPHGIDGSATERLLRLLSQVDQLAIIVTTRGTSPPFGQKTDIADIKSLTHVAASQTFLATAGESLKDDPDLDSLLSSLDGHPLSIVLLAAQARGQIRLRDLRLGFERQRTELLKKPGTEYEDRLTSTRASLRVSLENRAMSLPTKRLFGLLAFLPAGMSRIDSDRLIGNDTFLARYALQNLRLAFEREDGRLRVLAPLRDCAKLDCLPTEGDQKALFATMFAIARDASHAGGADWPPAAPRVLAEADNLDPILDTAIKTEQFKWIDVARELFGLTELHRFCGRGSVGVMDVAANYFSGDRLASAALSLWIGQIQYLRSAYRQSQRSLRRACTLARKADAADIQAHALLALSHISGSFSDSKSFEQQVQDAAALYRKIGHNLGEANCLYTLADMAFDESDHKKANNGFLAARNLYEKEGDLNGITNCIFKTALIEGRQANFNECRRTLADAITRYRKINALGNEANCILSLGGVSLEEGNFDAAKKYLESAATLFDETGSVIGKAEATIRMGDVYLYQQDFEAAEVLYLRAGEILATVSIAHLSDLDWRFGEVYERLGKSDADDRFDKSMEIRRRDRRDQALPGWEALYQNKLSKRSKGITTSLLSARERWQRIGRLDLISHFIDCAPIKS
jgi:tetratricopeptide (TPR) repeat protein